MKEAKVGIRYYWLMKNLTLVNAKDHPEKGDFPNYGMVVLSKRSKKVLECALHDRLVTAVSIGAAIGITLSSIIYLILLN